jgi:hypothetical protein
VQERGRPRVSVVALLPNRRIWLAGGRQAPETRKPVQVARPQVLDGLAPNHPFSSTTTSRASFWRSLEATGAGASGALGAPVVATAVAAAASAASAVVAGATRLLKGAASNPVAGVHGVGDLVYVVRRHRLVPRDGAATQRVVRG